MVLRLLDEVSLCVPVGIYCGYSLVGVFGGIIVLDLFRPLTVANRKIDRQRARVYIPLTYGIYTL